MAHLSSDAPSFSEADIEDAMSYQEDTVQDDDDYSMIEDELREAKELEMMVASYEEEASASQSRPPSLFLSDDEYDDIFAELISQEPSPSNGQSNSSDDMDMS